MGLTSKWAEARMEEPAGPWMIDMGACRVEIRRAGELYDGAVYRGDVLLMEAKAMGKAKLARCLAEMI